MDFILGRERMESVRTHKGDKTTKRHRQTELTQDSKGQGQLRLWHLGREGVELRKACHTLRAASFLQSEGAALQKQSTGREDAGHHSEAQGPEKERWLLPWGHSCSTQGLTQMAEMTKNCTSAPQAWMEGGSVRGSTSGPLRS